MAADPRRTTVPDPTDPLANPPPVPDHAPRELPLRPSEPAEPGLDEAPPAPLPLGTEHPLGPPEPVERIFATRCG